MFVLYEIMSYTSIEIFGVQKSEINKAAQSRFEKEL